MTNGEKLKEIFPNAEIDYGLRGVVAVNFIHKTIFDSDWWNAEYKEPTTKNDLRVDCISRESVLKLIYDYKENHSNDREHYPINYGTLLDMIRWVCNLPSVTPQEPKKGHWEHGRELFRVFMGDTLKGINYEDWHCSNCHCVVEQSIKPKWSYCPNCGAKMAESEG